jgi:hypothetical protein
MLTTVLQLTAELMAALTADELTAVKLSAVAGAGGGADS